jgi:hypothetical protein
MDNPVSFINGEVHPVHAQKNLTSQLRGAEWGFAVSYAGDDKLPA